MPFRAFEAALTGDLVEIPCHVETGEAERIAVDGAIQGMDSSDQGMSAQTCTRSHRCCHSGANFPKRSGKVIIALRPVSASVWHVVPGGC